MPPALLAIVWAMHWMDCAFSYLQVLAQGHSTPLHSPSTSHHRHASIPSLGAGLVFSSTVNISQIPLFIILGTSFPWRPLQLEPTFLLVTFTCYHFVKLHILSHFDKNFWGQESNFFSSISPITCHSGLRKKLFLNKQLLNEWEHKWMNEVPQQYFSPCHWEKKFW